MDRQYIENEQIVERYLSGDLTVREAREFQRFCSTHPELLDEWSLPAGLKAQLTRQVQPSTNQPGEALAVETEESAAIYTDGRPCDATQGRPFDSAQPRHWIRAWRRWPNLAPVLAATLLVTLGGLLVVAWQVRNLNQQLAAVTRAKQDSELQAHSTVQAYRVKLVRGRPQRPTVTVGWPMPPELVDLYIDVTEGNYSSFQVTIDRVDGSRVLQIRRLMRDSNRELRLALNSSAFGPGEYLMKFDGYTWRGQPQELGWIRLGLE